MSLQGQVALIAGEGSIGSMETAVSLARQGVHLALHYDAETSRCTALMAQNLMALNPHLRITMHPGQLANAYEIDRLFSDVKLQHGKLDMVVNCQGKVLKKLANQASEADADHMLAYRTFVDAQAQAFERQCRTHA